MIARQIEALLTAAYTTSITVKTFTPIGVNTGDLVALRDAESEVLQSCKELKFKFNHRHLALKGTDKIVNMLAKAAKLQKLHLSLDFVLGRSWPLLQELLAHRVHWPNI